MSGNKQKISATFLPLIFTDATADIQGIAVVSFRGLKKTHQRFIADAKRSGLIQKITSFHVICKYSCDAGSLVEQCFNLPGDTGDNGIIEDCRQSG